MSRGFGSVQTAILEALKRRSGGDVVEAHCQKHLRLAPTVHDMRMVSALLNDDGRGFCEHRKQAAFSRALKGLVESRVVVAYPHLVPLADCWPKLAS